jgi:hypothetical protein
MKHLIFHLNILADPAMIRALIQEGTARMLGEIYGDEQAWFSAYSKVLGDWNSYHADLNFSGEDGMADMREARFRIMRALFRIRGIAELSQDEIHALADKALRAIDGDVFFHDSHDLLNELGEKYSISLVSYLPQAQVETMAKVAKVHHCFGADTFEQYEMNQRYFEMLLIRLKAKPEDCIYIDKQAQVLETASKLGVKTCLAQNGIRVWMHVLKNFL